MDTESCNNEDGRIILESALDQRATASLKEELLVMRGANLVIDASQVERIGAQCVQVLLSAVKTWALDGHTIAIFDESPAFSEAATHLGVCLSNTKVSESESCH